MFARRKLSQDGRRLRRARVVEIRAPHEHLRGRGGALRVKGAREDLLLVAGYPPPTLTGEAKGKAQRQAAEKLGCAFLNPSELFGNDPNDVVQRWRTDKWLGGDLAHLTNTGHRMLGNAVAGWFISEYERWKASRVSAPATP